MSKSRRREGASSVAPVSGRPTRVKRSAPPKSFIERYRNSLIGLGAVVVVGLIAVAGFGGASAPKWSCSTVWTEPASTPQPAPGATARIGYVQDDLGRGHIGVGDVQRYPICPPASGKHANQTGSGPIAVRVYGPDDDARPQGWIHNLEHGGMVILYSCADGPCQDEDQAALRDLFATFPPGPVCGTPAGSVGPVIARFDEMSTPYAALVWGQILPLKTLDRELIFAFWNQQGERTNPEPLCARPSPTPPPTVTPTAAPSASPSPSPSDSPTPSPS